jgi:hypothetical protein
VYRLLNPLSFAAGSAATDFFKAQAKCRYLGHNGRSAAAEEKQQTACGPEGCVENGSAVFRRPPDQSRIDPFDALSLAHGKPSEANEVNTGDTGRVRKRVECPEQATARRMGQICSFSASPARTASQTTHFERNETQGI